MTCVPGRLALELERDDRSSSAWVVQRDRDRCTVLGDVLADTHGGEVDELDGVVDTAVQYSDYAYGPGDHDYEYGGPNY